MFRLAPVPGGMPSCKLLHAFQPVPTSVAYLVMQANYQLVLPNIRDYLTDIGAVVSMAGVVIGCCDIASIPGTVGEHSTKACLAVFILFHTL